MWFSSQNKTLQFLKSRCEILENKKPLQKDPSIIFFQAIFCQLASFEKIKQHGFVKMDGFEPSILP
jgi:hypothetical protein